MNTPVIQDRIRSWLIDLSSFSRGERKKVAPIGRFDFACDAATCGTALFTGDDAGILDRGFDIASQVAVRREGDCTSARLPALARGAGIPGQGGAGACPVRRDSVIGAMGMPGPNCCGR
jgi:hypothetical protein